jgi:hypothetical protein
MVFYLKRGFKMSAIPVYYPVNNTSDLIITYLEISFTIVGIILFIYQTFVLIKKNYNDDYKNIKRPITLWIVGICLIIIPTLHYKSGIHMHDESHDNKNTFIKSP